MHRIYCSVKDIIGDKIVISDRSLIHHIKDVLRAKINRRIVVCDDSGNEYDSVIEKLSSQNMLLKIVKAKKFLPAGKIRITAACALPKRAKFDDIVDKLTQLGVDKIIPMQTQRVTLNLDRHKQALRLGRWQKIALNASGQSQRNRLPVVTAVMPVKQVLEQSAEFDLKLIPALTGERKTLKQVLSVLKPRNILFLIGPEGDFTPEELSGAVRLGFIPITLGEGVLRVETAAVAVMSILDYALNRH